MEDNKYHLKTPFFALAPMANITTYPFASQAVKYGADIVWTPMVHTDTIIFNWPEAEKILDFREVKNYLIQIVGSDPEKIALSINIIEQKLNPLGIDLNFACPDKNIIKSGCGGALLTDQKNMINIIKMARISTSRPLSVKTRLGWEDPNQIFEIVPKFFKNGVDLVTVHGRTVKQGFRGDANWEYLKNLKNKNKKGLICGSGDITDFKKARDVVKNTNLDGIMIGRGSLGKPWIFKEIKEEIKYVPDLNEIMLLTLDLAKKYAQIWPQKGIIEARKHFAWYFRGFPQAAHYRKKLMNTNNLGDVEAILGL